MSDETVRVDFQAGGIREVAGAFRSVEQSLLALDRLAARASDADEKRLTKKRQMEEQARSKSVSAAKQFEEARAAISKKAQDEVLKHFEETEKKKTKAAENASRERIRLAEAEGKAKAKAAEAAASKTKERAANFNSAIGGAATRGVSNAAGTIMQYGGMAVGMGGGLAIADAMRSGMSSEKAAVALANSMFNPGDENGQAAWLADPKNKNKVKNGRFDAKAIMQSADAMSVKTGLDKEELMKGWQDYIAKSSDWQAVATPGGQGALQELAELAVGGGANFGEVMGAAGSMRVQNPELTPEKLVEMMRGVVGQGKKGAVEMSDLAKHASVITSGAGKFKIGEGGYKDQAAAQSAMLGLSQVAIRTSGSPADAATAVARFGSDLAGKADKAQASFKGLKLKDDKGNLLKASTLVENIFNATKGDTSKMGEGKGNIGMGMESIKIMNALKTQYTTAYNKAKAGGATEEDAVKAGSAAAGKEVSGFENTTYSKEHVDRDFQEVMNTNSMKIENSMRVLRNALESKMLPVVERLSGAFVRNESNMMKFVDAIGKAAEYFIDNPFKGIGIVIGASVAKEVGQAAIGSGLKAVLEKQVGKSLGGGLNLGSTLSILATAVAIEQVGEMVINNLADKKDAREAKAHKDDTNLVQARGELERKIRTGKLSEKDIADARAAVEAGQANLQQQKDNYQDKNQGALENFWENSSLLLGGKEAEDARNARKAQQAQTIESTQKSLADLQKALDLSAEALRQHAATAAKAAADPNNPNRKAPQTAPSRGGAGSS